MTQQQADRSDRLVEDYLGAVSYACVDLPPQQRAELVEDLREHISAARAVLYQPTEAAVRTILDRLGEPAAIAAEARLGEPEAATQDAPVAGPSPATLGIVLGFVLIIIVVIVVGSIVLGIVQ
jgi:uncharacterized membrane protein